MPLRREASTMLIAMTVGRQRRTASPTSIRLRGMFVASVTTSTTSGASTASPRGASCPASTSRQMAASDWSSSRE